MGNGRVYIIGGSAGPLKIGSTGNVKTRLAGLQTGYPYRLRSFGSWPHGNAEMVEGYAQYLLRDRKLIGEWFDVTKDQAREAIQRAIRITDGKEVLPREAPPTPGWMLPDVPERPHVEVGDGMHRMGYAREVSDCPKAKQIDWLLASGVHHLDIWVEKDRGRDKLVGLLKDYRDGDLLLAWSPAVFGREQIAEQVGLSIKTLYAELGRRPPIRKGRSR